MDRIYGRPKQAVDVNTGSGIDVSALEPGQRMELMRLVAEHITVAKSDPEP
jgi:hypothetical protein